MEFFDNFLGSLNIANFLRNSVIQPLLQFCGPGDGSPISTARFSFLHVVHHLSTCQLFVGNLISERNNQPFKIVAAVNIRDSSITADSTITGHSKHSCEKLYLPINATSGLHIVDGDPPSLEYGQFTLGNPTRNFGPAIPL